MVALAFKKLRNVPRRAADEEDVVLSAFKSLCQRAEQDQFPDLRDRSDLWHLIVRITERKIFNQLRAETRQKRGGGKVVGESALAGADSSDGGGFYQVAGPEPTPAFAAEMVESFEGLLRCLDDNELRQIALLKLEGYANQEIADQIGRSLPTVERRLQLIRKTWKGMADDDR